MSIENKKTIKLGMGMAIPSPTVPDRWDIVAYVPSSNSYIALRECRLEKQIDPSEPKGGGDE